MAKKNNTPKNNDEYKSNLSEANTSDSAENEDLYDDNTAGTIFSADSDVETGNTKSAKKTEKKNKKKQARGKAGKSKMPIIILIVVIVVAAALVGVFFLVQNFMPDSNDTTSATYPTDENGEQYATDLKGNKINSYKDQNGNILSAGVEELIDHVPADIKTVEVTNANGSFELLSETPTETTTDADGNETTTTSETIYTLKDYEDVPLATGMPDAVANDAAAVTTTNIVDINGENLSEYGLDKPRATAKVTFVNGNARTITVGNDAPDSAGTYIMVDGDKAVYLVSVDAVDSFLYKVTALFDANVTSAAEDSENATPSKATISGTNFKDTLEFEKNDDTTVSTAYYKMTLPTKCFVNVTNGSTVLDSLRSISADEAVEFKPSDEKLSEYGISTSKPYAKISAEFGDGNITLYSSEPKEEEKTASTDAEGSTDSTSDSYVYVYNPSTKMIYKMSSTKAPWATTSYEDMVFEYVMKPDLKSIKTIEITAGDKTYKFDISTETNTDDDGNETTTTSVKSGEKKLDTGKFDIFFQNLESATVNEVKSGNVSGSAELTVKFTYNTDKAADTYTFYKGDTGKYDFSIDGKAILGDVFDTYVNKIIEDAPKMANGEDVTSI